MSLKEVTHALNEYQVPEEHEPVLLEKLAEVFGIDIVMDQLIDESFDFGDDYDYTYLGDD